MTSQNDLSAPSLCGKKVLIAGGSGHLGSALVQHLRAAGAEVVILSRRSGPGCIFWNPRDDRLNVVEVEGFDVWINLAGAPIARRWTGRRREEIYQSRIRATRLLMKVMAGLEKPPSVFLSASGINYYASGSMAETRDEMALPGNDFLGRVCVHWEQEAGRMRKGGVRTVLLRTAAVLDPAGGALAKMLPAFRMGAGGPIGDGRQPFPWISLRDWLRAVEFLLCSELAGPFNLVSPGLVEQRVFASALGQALGRPAFVPLPRLALKMMFGEMGEEMLAKGVAGVPAALLAAGFDFQDADVTNYLLSACRP